jgi:hypothetical protein
MYISHNFSCQQSFLGLRDLCINRNNHQKPTFHPLGDFLNPALALLGQGLKKSPIGQKLEYQYQPKAGSPEAKLYEYYLKPQDWINAN